MTEQQWLDKAVLHLAKRFDQPPAQVLGLAKIIMKEEMEASKTPLANEWQPPEEAVDTELSYWID